MLWLMTMGRRLNGVYAAFMLVAFMMGVAGALQAPTLSLFLSREVGAQPFWVGLFYTVNAIAGILVSLWLAKRSDSRGDRRRLIMFCCLMAVGNALLFAFNRHYLTLITCGVMLASIANAAMPQLFALAREYADSSAREVVMFSSVMRAQLSLAWVIGPPLAFMLALNYGFTTMFSIAAGIFVISLALIAIKLPSVPRVEQPSEEAAALAQAGGWQDKNVRMLFIASTLMWTCNTMYIIDMPLWISSDLGLPDSLAGIDRLGVLFKATGFWTASDASDLAAAYQLAHPVVVSINDKTKTISSLGAVALAPLFPFYMMYGCATGPCV